MRTSVSSRSPLPPPTSPRVLDAIEYEGVPLDEDAAASAATSLALLTPTARKPNTWLDAFEAKSSTSRTLTSSDTEAAAPLEVTAAMSSAPPSLTSTDTDATPSLAPPTPRSPTS